MSPLYRFPVILVLLLAGIFSISAQTTIFNTPSTDVVSEKSVYLEADFYAHFDKLKNGGFQTYGYKTVYGLRKKVEIGTSFFFTRSNAPKLNEFQANAKYRFYANEKLGIAATAGTQVFIPIRNKTGLKTFSMFYSNASKVIPQAKNLRVTGGYYRLVGVKQADFGSKQGAIVGVEQPVLKKLNFLADWYSGKNRFGYAAAGFSIPVTKRQIIYAGYNFGNVGRANNAFSFFYGFNY
jgi:hypothetical protein